MHACSAFIYIFGMVGPQPPTPKVDGLPTELSRRSSIQMDSPNFAKYWGIHSA